MRKKGNPRFKQVTKYVRRKGKRVKTTVYKLKKGAKRK